MSNQQIQCSCLECKEIRSAKGLHTHFERKHGTEEQKSKYSSGNNGKYHLLTERSKHKKNIKEQLYYENPKYCLTCNTVILFEKSHVNKFCNKSCSIIYSNKNRTTESFAKQSTSLKLTLSKKINSKIYKDLFPWTAISFKLCKLCNSPFVFPNPNCTKSFCSKQCFSKNMSIKASVNSRNNPNCGGKRNSIRIKAIDSFNNNVTLDSSYELILSKSLDEHNIKWIRPKHFWYILV